jgi:hypothetical protein
MEEVNSHLGVKNHDPDARPPRYGQQRAEEVLGCKMSGWLTPKLVGTEKLWGFPLGTGAPLCWAPVQSAGRHTLGVMHKATHPLLQQALSGWERRRMILVGTGSQAGHMRVQGRAVPASAQRTKPCSTEKLGTRQAAHGHVHRGASA